MQDIERLSRDHSEDMHDLTPNSGLGIVRIIWITSNLLLLVYTIVLAIYYNCYKTKNILVKKRILMTYLDMMVVIKQ